MSTEENYKYYVGDTVHVKPWASTPFTGEIFKAFYCYGEPRYLIKVPKHYNGTQYSALESEIVGVVKPNPIYRFEMGEEVTIVLNSIPVAAKIIWRNLVGNSAAYTMQTLKQGSTHSRWEYEITKITDQEEEQMSSPENYKYSVGDKVRSKASKLIYTITRVDPRRNGVWYGIENFSGVPYGYLNEDRLELVNEEVRIEAPEETQPNRPRPVIEEMLKAFRETIQTAEDNLEDLRLAEKVLEDLLK